MQLTVNRFISFFTFASMVASSAVYSQTDNTAPTITPLSEIEDATLWTFPLRQKMVVAF